MGFNIFVHLYYYRLSGCVVDLVIVLDESDSVRRYQSQVENFIQNVVSPLPISNTEVHVSLGMFATSYRTMFDLDDLHTKSSVLSSLRHLVMHGGVGDTDEGLKYALHALTSRSGDRPTARNVVLIVTDDGTKNSGLLKTLEHEVHAKADVISVEIGPLLHFGHLATDNHHQFHIQSPTSLSSISQQVSALICSN